jgi:hypothetical protein
MTQIYPTHCIILSKRVYAATNLSTKETKNTCIYSKLKQVYAEINHGIPPANMEQAKPQIPFWR